MAEYVCKVGSDVAVEGQLENWLGEGVQLATHGPNWHTSTSEHTRTFETSKCMETQTMLASPGTNNYGATILAADIMREPFI